MPPAPCAATIRGWGPGNDGANTTADGKLGTSNASKASAVLPRRSSSSSHEPRPPVSGTPRAAWRSSSAVQLGAMKPSKTINNQAISYWASLSNNSARGGFMRFAGPQDELPQLLRGRRVGDLRAATRVRFIGGTWVAHARDTMRRNVTLGPGVDLRHEGMQLLLRLRPISARRRPRDEGSGQVFAPGD